MADNENFVAPRLTARLLGIVSIAVDKHVIDDSAWPPRGGRALLLMLLATPGHRLSRDRVQDALWPDLGPEAARNACYKALHSARHVLEPSLAAREPGSFIRSSIDAIALVPGTFRVVIDDFEATIKRAGAESPNQRESLLREALAHYAGELLSQERTYEWVAERRDSLNRAWYEAAVQLAEIELRNGNPRDAIALLEEVAESEPTHEEAHRLLIQAYDRAGQRDLALRQYETCVAILREEFGVDPSMETQRIAVRLIEPELPRRSAHAGQPPSWTVAPVPPARLIGREDDLELLHELLNDADARLLTLLGPGGVGKTRLAVEAALQFADEFPDGVCFVSLAPMRDPNLVLSTIAQALGVREGGDVPVVARIAAALRARFALLVLDNFEHVLAAVPHIADILASCSEITILVTSREPLHL